MLLLIYCHKITERVKYTFNFVFKQNLGINYAITTNRDDFLLYEGPRLNYSFEAIENIIHIQPALILNQDDIAQQYVDVKKHNTTTLLFFNNKGNLLFDIFAATFYLITRYEEYMHSRLDRFGRFNPYNSIAHQEGFLNEPIVNIWINQLRNLLKSYYHTLEMTAPKYTFQPTIDIDRAYAYKHTGFIRQVGGLVKSLLKNRPDFFRRLKVYAGREQDPYDTYSVLNQIHEQNNVSPYYFFLMANYGGFDKSLPISNKTFQNLISEHARKYKTGIHPSYMSYFDFSILQDEISSLYQLLGKNILCNRFHFVKFSLPESYEKLINLNILHDFSMGYPAKIGFRNGYAGDHLFFNLQTNRETTLTIHPFQVMDTTLRQYMKLSADEAIMQTKEMIDKVKAVKGKFTLLWHNESLSGIEPWRNWKSTYSQIVQYAKE